MRKAWILAAVMAAVAVGLVSALLFPGGSHSGLVTGEAVANGLTHTTTVAVPHAPIAAADLAQAAKIKTPADLNAAPPAVRQAFLTVTSVTTTVTTRSSTPGVALSAQVNYGIGGCHDVSASEWATNALGWVLIKQNMSINDWCTVRNLYGIPVIYSQPWVGVSASAAWGYVGCGYTNQRWGFMSNGSYQAWSSARFGLGKCVVTEFQVNQWEGVYPTGEFAWTGNVGS